MLGPVWTQYRSIMTFQMKSLTKCLDHHARSIGQSYRVDTACAYWSAAANAGFELFPPLLLFPPLPLVNPPPPSLVKLLLFQIWDGLWDCRWSSMSSSSFCTHEKLFVCMSHADSSTFLISKIVSRSFNVFDQCNGIFIIMCCGAIAHCFWLILHHLCALTPQWTV